MKENENTWWTDLGNECLSSESTTECGETSEQNSGGTWKQYPLCQFYQSLSMTDWMAYHEWSVIIVPQYGILGEDQKHGLLTSDHAAHEEAHLDLLEARLAATTLLANGILKYS